MRRGEGEGEGGHRGKIKWRGGRRGEGKEGKGIYGGEIE